MAQILRIGATDIEQALSGVTRQYLVGKLGRAQALRHIPHAVVEIGVTRYGPQGGTEAPHTHRQAFEYQYMLEGKTIYLDITAQEEHVFYKGDFYAGRGLRPEVSTLHEDSVHQSSTRERQDPRPATPDVEAWLNNPIAER